VQRTALLIGAGHMGRSALGILLRRLPELTVTVVDRDPGAVATAQAIDPRRVDGVVGDVTAEDFHLPGADLVLNLAGPFFAGSDRAARHAIAAGAAYVDIADDVEATTAVLALDDDARRAGVPVLTGAGNSPGVSNWLAADLIEQHGDVDGIQVVWVTHEPDPGGLAPLRHMLHMAVTPCPLWRDGRMQQSPGFVPSTAATYDLPAPVGPTEAYDTTHPEPFTLPRRFPHLRYVGCKGALAPAWANAAFSTLGRIGFGYSDVRLEYGDRRIEPAEFLWRLLWQRHDRRERPPAESTTMIHVIGLAGDRPVAAHTIWDPAPMYRGTGLGAAVAALMLLEDGAPAGAAGVEVLPHRKALDLFFELADRDGGFPAGLISTIF
jgi:lysine 6-dehydrogenase